MTYEATSREEVHTEPAKGEPMHPPAFPMIIQCTTASPRRLDGWSVGAAVGQTGMENGSSDFQMALKVSPLPSSNLRSAACM